MATIQEGYRNAVPPGAMLQEVERRMSKSLQAALAGGLELSWSNKHELIQLLSDVLYHRDSYPSKDMKNGIAKALVNKYPQLKNRLGGPECAWVKKINNGLKLLCQKE